MPTTSAIRLLFIIPFLFLVGCEQQAKDRAYELACSYPKEHWFNMLDKKLQEIVYDEDLYQFTGEYIKSIDLGKYEKAMYFLEIQTKE